MNHQYRNTFFKTCFNFGNVKEMRSHHCKYCTFQ